MKTRNPPTILQTSKTIQNIVLRRICCMGCSSFSHSLLTAVSLFTKRLNACTEILRASVSRRKYSQSKTSNTNLDQGFVLLRIPGKRRPRLSKLFELGSLKT